MNQFDMFGFNLHRWTRFLAAFLVAPYLIYKGTKYNDILLIIFGAITFIFDTITLYYTYVTATKDVCYILQPLLVAGFMLFGGFINYLIPNIIT